MKISKGFASSRNSMPLPLLISYDYMTENGSAAMSGTVVMQDIESMSPDIKKELESRLKNKIESAYNTKISIISITGWQRFESDHN